NSGEETCRGESAWASRKAVAPYQQCQFCFLPSGNPEFQMVATATSTGKVTQVIGSTLDAEFPEGSLPALYNALEVQVTTQVGTETVTEKLVCEVATHLGGGRV